MVQMRDYSSRREWVRGHITNKIGNKMYKVRFAGKLYIWHIDQLIQIDSKFKEDVDQDDDWYFDIESPICNNANSRRYPQRIRRPVVHYGIDD